MVQFPDVEKLLFKAKALSQFVCLETKHTLCGQNVMKEFANSDQDKEEQFFGYRLSSARMVIECVFGRLKARFGFLARDMHINLDDLPCVVHSCSIIKRKLINKC